MMKLKTMILSTMIVAACGGSIAGTYRQVGVVEDFSYRGVKRIGIRVVVPDGLSRQQLREDLGVLAMKCAQEHKADAATVYAYRAQDKDIATSAWVVGSAVYAPNGKWEDAGKNAPKKVAVELGEIYFKNTPADVPKAGSQVKLYSKSNRPIKVSKSRDEWSGEQIIAEVPAGTSAKVLERYEKALSSTYLFVRYHIEVVHQGRTIQGWVFEKAVQ